MSEATRWLVAFAFISLPTIAFGGYFLLTILKRQAGTEGITPVQRDYFRAGHAHAGVLVLPGAQGEITVERDAHGIPRIVAATARDAWFGLGIAAYILWSAIQIAKESFAVLMDEELPPDVSQHMLELARGVPGVLGAHDLRTRISGTRWFVQLHLELPGEISLSQAHAHCVAVEAAIRSEFPRAEVLVHADPPEVVER